jgi:hypothetical protein
VARELEPLPIVRVMGLEIMKNGPKYGAINHIVWLCLTFL